MKTASTMFGLTVLMLLTVGCGANNMTQTTDSASSAGALTTAAAGQVACNKASTNGDFEVKLMPYTDSQGFKNTSLLRLKITKMPASYVSDGLDIHIKKWTASSTGVVRPATGEAAFYVNTRIDFKNNNGSYTPASNWNYNLDCDTCPTLEWTNMRAISLATGNSGVTSTDPLAFFDRFQPLLDLQDTAGDWKALQINLVDKSGVAVRSINVLIPTFAANPVEYQKSHPPVLNNIHPFVNMLNQGWSTSQFQTESNSYCF